MKNSNTRILISGAGIGGLTAALALLKRGFDVQVYEQATELREVGAGLQLSPNALRVLYQLGLQNNLRDVAVEPTGKEIRLWNTGQSWKLFDLGASAVEQYGYPYAMIYRPDLHQMLLEAVRERRADAIVFSAVGCGFLQNEWGVTLRLTDGREIHGDALVGADGVHSRLRGMMQGVDQPVFSGCMAWRGVIPIERLPERMRHRVGSNWVGPGAHVIHYPLRRGELINFVGIVERNDWRIESWTQQGRREECHADFRGWHDDVHELIRNLETPFRWALMGRAPLQQWSQGSFTLLGDACHPTLPFLAQGAAMAIEDGYILARCLDLYAPDLPLALKRYADARIERTKQVVLRSSENGRRFHNPELASAEGAAAYIEREWAEDKVRERYDWLFRYNVDEVPV